MSFKSFMMFMMIVMIVMNMYWNMDFFDDWHMDLLNNRDVFDDWDMLHNGNLLHMVVMDRVNLVGHVDGMMFTVYIKRNEK